MIKKETFIERLLNAVHPVELKFDGDPMFNKNFNVLVNEKNKATKAMTPAFRNAIKEIKLSDFIIEIVNSTLIIGSVALITPQQTEELSLVASNLSTVK